MWSKNKSPLNEAFRKELKKLHTKAVDRISDEYPLIKQLFRLAKNVLPEFQSKGQKEEYIQRMITKGGITEAIIKSLQSCEPFDASLRKGVPQTGE